MGYRAHVVKKFEIKETDECFFNYKTVELYNFLNNCNIEVYPFSGESCLGSCMWHIDNSIDEIKDFCEEVKNDIHKDSIAEFFIKEKSEYEVVKNEIILFLNEIINNCNDTDGIHLYWY